MGKSAIAKQNSKWNQSMKRVCAKEGINLDDVEQWWQRNAPSTRGLRCTARVEGLIDVAIALSKGRRSEDRMPSMAHDHRDQQELFIDISQDVDRRPWSSPGLRSVTTSSEFFSLRHKRLLLPIEHYQLLGFAPLRNPQDSKVSATQHRDLSGEAMSPPVVALAILGVLSQVL